MTVQNIQAIAGTHSIVPAPELVILSTAWNVQLNTSRVIGVTLNITTTGGTGLANVTKIYTIFIQVSCLDTSNNEFECSFGTVTVTLRANMNGSAVSIFVPLSPTIDPELTEIHDLSFIVTGSPTTPPGTCSPDFAITATPSSITLNRTSTAPAIVVKTFTSICNFQGTIVISESPPAGVSASVSPAAVTLTPGGVATATDAFIASPSAPTGTFTATITATSGSTSHSVSISVTIV